MANIKIEGLDEAIKKLESLNRLNRLKPAFRAAAAHVKGKIAIYPAATLGNSESNPTGRWYQRGYGPKWKRKDGSIGGKKSSETLGRKWTHEALSSGIGARIGNNVTYGPFVHDPAEQTSFHKAHGWKTTEQVAQEESGAVNRIIKRQVGKLLED